MAKTTRREKKAVAHFKARDSRTIRWLFPERVQTDTRHTSYANDFSASVVINLSDGRVEELKIGGFYVTKEVAIARLSVIIRDLKKM